MSELSPDARDLIAQARKQGGPSAEQRAQLRAKLTPLWAAETMQPRAAGGLRWKLGAITVLAGLGLLGWLATQAIPASQPMAANRALQATTAPDALPIAAALPLAADHAAEQSNDEYAAPHTEPCPDALASAGKLQGGRRCAAGADAVGGPDTDTCVAGSGPACPDAIAALPRAPSPPAAAIARRPRRVPSARDVHSDLTAGALNGDAAKLKAAAEAPSAARAEAQPTVHSEPPAERDMLAERGLSSEHLGAPAASRERRPARSDLGRGVAGVGAPAGSRDVRRVQPVPDRLPLGATEDRPPALAVRTEADPGPPSIDGELELLGSAQTALQRQQPSRALTLLQEHAFRFPTGAMVEERMAMQALALCALQRRHAAQTVLSNLEARGSQSQLLPRVRSQCGL